ncbi:hypothetical protein N0V85_005154 [Neurospora sp. IMI 360204]|nr:hypothetical protein N0V85_005154 [Neurospora sp. IMI 360204]
MSLQSDSGYSRHQRPKETSRPPDSAELVSQHVLEVRARVIYYIMARKRDSIIRLADIDERFTQTDPCAGHSSDQNLWSVDDLCPLASSSPTPSSADSDRTARPEEQEVLHDNTNGHDEAVMDDSSLSLT